MKILSPALDPKWPKPLARRGWFYLAENRYKEAIEDLSGAIRLTPNNALWFVSRSHAYERTGQAQLALGRL